MSSFVVEGGRKLSGFVTVSGNKNEAMPLIAASLLCKKPVKLSNVPTIGDVRDMLSIATALGAKVTQLQGNSVVIDASDIATSELPKELSGKIRGSILFIASLLARTGKAVFPQPGGDKIGRRRIDTHFLVFESLGAKIEKKREKIGAEGELLTYTISAPKGLEGTQIYLDEASVTATENAVIAAAVARGVTCIYNAASEPHVQGVCRFLQAMGVTIEGIGSNILTVHGTGEFSPCEFTVGCDYIEVGSFIGLAAATRSSITIANVDTYHLRMILFQFERIGVKAEVDHVKHLVHIPEKQAMVVRKDLGGAIPKIEDSPWPGFPADLMSILLVTATQAQGTILIHEKMFESRLFFVDKLIAMGAQIVLCDPHRAVVVGHSPLYGSSIASPDIRAGMALLIAALAAEGTSYIDNIAQIDRGYERIEERLNNIGATITRVESGYRLK